MTSFRRVSWLERLPHALRRTMPHFALPDSTRTLCGMELPPEHDEERMRFGRDVCPECMFVAESVAMLEEGSES